MAKCKALTGSAVKALICRTHQHYRRQWLPTNDEKKETRYTSDAIV